MIKRMGVVAMLMIGLLSAGAAAQVEVREEVEATRQTPRGTLKLLRQAMEQGEGEALKSILLAENDVETQMVDAMVQTAQSVQGLRQAAVEKFGERAAETLTGPAPAEGTGQMPEIDEATATIEDDRAVVRFADVQVAPVTLIQRGEQWHVPVGALAGKLSERELAERIAEVRMFNGVITAVAAEIAEGKYESAEQARQAMSTRMLQAASEETD